MNITNLDSISHRQRLTQYKKNQNDYKWYHDQADLLDHHSFSGTNNTGFGGVSEYRRKKVNYDLFNNIIDTKEFAYVCQPYGAEQGELPANFANRDIVSGKIKVLLGMEMGMPFDWKVIATNEEATTRKEQAEAKMIQDYVMEQIMQPIRMQVQQEFKAQEKGRQLSEEEQVQLQQEMDKQVKARTPEEARKYMIREHQDPAEMLSQQILQYLIYKEQIPAKFNKGWKHSNLAGEEVYWVGIVNGEPKLKVVNPLYFDYDKSPDTEEIEYSEWTAHELRLSPSEVVNWFGSELTEEEIDKVYDRAHTSPTHTQDLDWSFNPMSEPFDGYTIRVMHFEWTSLRKVGFLTYKGKNPEPEMDIVDENYKFNAEAGDIDLTWEWIPEKHEAYKIMNDMYAFCRPVQGQFKDFDNLYDCKGSYFGAAVDNLNSPITSPMDRLKAYQYFYNVIIYRIELLMASDKGKIIALNSNAIPTTNGYTVKKFMYFLEANKRAFLNPNEEGNKNRAGEVGSLAQVLDLSLVSDITKYMQIAEYIERKAGTAIGITPQMEAQISASEAVTNTKQNIVQASHIIRPYFELHNTVKANVLQGLIEKAKVAYSRGRPRKLSYVLDDMSYAMISLTQDSMAMLEDSTLGLFVANSSKAHEAKEAITGLAQAAMQNQQADLGDIVKVMRAESITEAEELLESARQRKQEEIGQIEQQKLQMQDQMDQRAAARQNQAFEQEKELIVLKEGERRKTQLQKSAIAALGFAKDTDQDDDGTPDVLEVYKLGIQAQIDNKKLALDQQKLTHTMKTDQKKLEQGDKKLKIDQQKANKPTASK